MFILFFLFLVLARAITHPMRCMNFYGLETPTKDLVCSWKHPPSYYLDALDLTMGINTIRIPFSYEYIYGYDISKLDDLILECQRRNMTVILDYHRTWATHQGPVPEEGITLEDFQNMWINVLNRFQTFNNVQGVGIFNEIQSNDPDYAAALYEGTIKKIEERFPDRFSYFTGCVEWGTDCEKVGDLLSHTSSTWNRTYLDVHKYKFNSDTTEAEWDRTIPLHIDTSHWFVGEIGWKMSSPSEKQWAERFLAYLARRNIRNVCLWTIAHSYDTEGWFNDDCETFDYDKAYILNNTIWSPTVSPPSPSPASSNRKCKCRHAKPN